MILLPMQVSRTAYVLTVVLKPDNIERIEHYDPAQLIIGKLGPEWAALRLLEIHIAFATDEDEALIIGWMRKDDLGAALKHLTRGFKFRPEAGDHDGPAQSLLDGKMQ